MHGISSSKEPLLRPIHDLPFRRLFGWRGKRKEVILYQYRARLDEKGLGYLRDLLESGKLMFSPPNNFNDPFDCYPRNADFAEKSGDDLPHAAVDSLNYGHQRAIGALLGIACFTPDPVNHLMWSHYGDHHRSVCIGFDGDVLRKRAPKNDKRQALYEGPRMVRYRKKRPNEDDPKCFVIKSRAWKYEKERRLFAPQRSGSPAGGPGVGTIPVEAICQVVLGARMKPDVQACVQELAARHAPEALVKKVVIHKGTYELVLENQAAQPVTRLVQGTVRAPDGTSKPIPE